ncbi:PCTP-like protein [Aphelenchoides bicaudatus]|nr:PCTP-like protein [Aphelenchoides bicaudatus]
MVAEVETGQIERPLHGVQVNSIKFYDDNDFKHAKMLCESGAEWLQVYRKKATAVWTRATTNSEFDMIRARTELDFSAEILYDVLQDGEFRARWDRYMIETVDIGFLNPNHDLCYYAMGGFPPFRSRDFVLQRSWLDLGAEKILCTHSVCHKDYPATSNHIRGIVYLTVYFIRSLSKDRCQITYLTHSNPKGKLPSWLTNKLTQVVAPQVFKRLQKACKEYPSWKETHNQKWKPWRFPEQQLDLPRINVQEMCTPTDDQQEVVNEEKIDESVVKISE